MAPIIPKNLSQIAEAVKTMEKYDQDAEDFRRPVAPDQPLSASQLNAATSAIVKEYEAARHGLKDSGSRRQFTTGAVRDAGGIEKGRPSLRPIHAIRRLDLHMGKGAAKYAARNWEKGIPLSVFWESMQNHADKLMAGYEDEDHAAAALWNIACYIETEHRIKLGLLPAELDDMPHTFRGLQPNF